MHKDRSHRSIAPKISSSLPIASLYIHPHNPLLLHHCPIIMNIKLKKSQILMLTLLALLLFLTPFIPSSLKPKYLYFLINLLIIALGAEAGLLSAAFSKPYVEEKRFHTLPPSTKKAHEELSFSPDTAKAVEKSAPEKCVENAAKDTVRFGLATKCPSMPSLFFIGGGESNEADYNRDEKPEEEEEGGGEDGGLSGQELFTKAENFIGNFYKQLKMQREESWKKIHGFYQKAF